MRRTEEQSYHAHTYPCECAAEEDDRVCAVGEAHGATRVVGEKKARIIFADIMLTRQLTRAVSGAVSRRLGIGGSCTGRSGVPRAYSSCTVLGIESSFDDSSVGIVRGIDGVVLADCTISQRSQHMAYVKP